MTGMYLDAASTEPVSEDVIRAMMPFLTEAYANPMSVHSAGKTAAKALEAARASLAADLGARPDDVIFTSGGTESDNLAVKGIAMARIRRMRDAYGESVTPRIIVSSIEHPAVLESARWLERWFGCEVVEIPVDAQAHIDLDALRGELEQGRLDVPSETAKPRNATVLVSAMLANNEVGTVEPVDDIARIAHACGVPLHVDAVQAAGQIPIRMREWDVDALSLSGHKFGAPKGLGALLLRSRVPVEPLMSGGGQERSLRSGTQNVAGAVALAVALRDANVGMRDAWRSLAASRDRLVDAVLRVEPRAQLTGDPRRRLPGHASFVFPGLSGEALLVDLDARGIACSSGSACAVGRHEAPGTLMAMGYEPAVAKSAIRMTFREPLTPEQINRIASVVEESCSTLRGASEVGDASINIQAQRAVA
ncbi:MAG TPA: cysteine desulfurase [Bifidobacterium sp.]|nr:cysteine desulfurase [Bifidobacterium sp.]